MSDSESGGEHTNAEYYKHLWGKPPRTQTEPKPARVNHKRHGEAKFHLPQKSKSKVVRRKAVRPPVATNR